MKLILHRRMLMNGALTGTLSVEHRNEYGRLSGIEKICDTIERKNGQLPTGEYRVVIGKCSRFARQMIFLEPIKEEDDSSSASEAFVSEASSSEVSSSETASSSSSLPLPETCKLCRMERKSHEFGCLEELYALPCPMMQPGNGPFRLRQGGILIGEAHAPGFVLKSQERFLQLYDRIKKVIARGGEVVIKIE
jgi:hypothetical protein